MKGLSKIALPLLLAMMLTSCASSLVFEDGDAGVALEASPVQLSGEQVQLSEDQVTCGDREDLWNLTQLGSGRAIGKLTENGRALQFSDDVRVSGGGATAQVTGKFTLRSLQVMSVHDENEKTKLTEIRTGVVVNHHCFEGHSPVLMGVRRGEFTAAANPRFRLKLTGGDWVVGELLH